MGKWLAVALVVWLGLGATVSDAAEARCAELDAQFGAGTCHCSEPLNTNTYTLVAGTDWAWNAADSTTKQCNADVPGAALVSSGSHSSFATSGWQVFGVGSEPLNAFPTGHSVSFVAAQNGTSGIHAGGIFPSGASTKFRNLRFYRYMSSNFTFTDDAQVGCLNSGKMLQLGHGFLNGSGPLINKSYGTSEEFYDIATSLGYNASYECCLGNPPGRNPAAPSGVNAFRGKLLRYEFILRNADPSDAPITFTLYRKDVTKNAPNTTEYVVIDSRVVNNVPPSNVWPTAAATNLKNNQRLSAFGVNMFRGSNCTGYEAISHVLLASFATEQRIGAATEIESGGGPGPNTFNILATSATFGLTGAVAGLTRTAGPTQIGFIHTAAVLLVIIIAVLLILVLRRRRIHVD